MAKVRVDPVEGSRPQGVGGAAPARTERLARGPAVLVRHTGRLALWAVAALALLAAGAALLLAVLHLVVWLRSGGPPGDVQLAAWRALGGGVIRQALLPQLGLALALWVLFLRRYEGRRVLPGLLAAAVLAFPPVGLFSFAMWQPASTWDVIGTWALLAGVVALVLVLPRRLLPGLGSGAFAGARDGAAR